MLLEVRLPRTPCANPSQHIGVDGFRKEFHRAGRVGAKCRVIEEGTVAAGDQVVVEDRADHDVWIQTYLAGMSRAQAERLLASGVPPVRAKAGRIAHR